MVRLNASYSKKVPAEQDYSSKSFHASVEVELSDGLSQDELQKRIHDTFQIVRLSVESEISSNGKATGNGQTVPVQIQTPEAKANGNGQKKASDKQVKFLLDLARNCQINIPKVLSRYNCKNVYELDQEACSALINELKGTKATA